MKNKKWYLVAFVFLIMTYSKLFEFRPTNAFFNQLIVVVFFILIVFTFHTLSYKNYIFIKPIKYIIYSLFLAITSSVLFWKQSVIQSLIAIAPYSYFLVFLFLIKVQVDRMLIIRIVLFCSFVGLIAFAYQFAFPQFVLFGVKDEIIEDRGILRVVFSGEGFMFFALFYYLNKLNQNFKLKYLIYFLLFLTMMLVQVTRMYILAFGLIASYHFLIKSRIAIRITVFTVFLLCYSLFYGSENKFIKSIREVNNNDVEMKEDYIRLMSANYYLFEFSNNQSTYLLGNGAYNYKSAYGKKILGLNEDERFYLDDLGLLKGFILFGILFVVGYIIIFIKSFTCKIPNNQFYLKYFIWTILILSFTTRANTNAGFGVVFVTVLYLYERAYTEQNNLLPVKK